jgi:hypothetical protein
MPLLTVSCRQFAETIAATDPDGQVSPCGRDWQVTGTRLVIDPVACAEALGRPLLRHEREELAVRQTTHPQWAVSRLGGRVYLSPYQPSTSLTLRMPMALGDAIKEAIGARDLSVKDFVCLALRWYAVSWPDGDPALKAQVLDEYRDLHHWTGPRVKTGVVDERRWATHYESRKGRNDGLVSDEAADGGDAAGDALPARPDQGGGRRAAHGRTRGFLARLPARRRPADANCAPLDGA